MRVRYMLGSLARRKARLIPLIALIAIFAVYNLLRINFAQEPVYTGGLSKQEAVALKNALSMDEPTTATCDQRYSQEAHTELNTMEMYNNGMKSPGGVNEFNGRIKKTEGPLKVFVLPMTHVDPGWLKTFDDYTLETNRILDNVLNFLKEHPRMRFMWCEMVFFERWWTTLNSTQKNDIKDLVSSGQLEMTSGSWVMTDEANPLFAVTLDNIIDGQQFVFDQLGVKPRTMWSNDPFGYGSTVPFLFSKTGVKWAVINRIHHPMKNYLQSLRAIPFNWRQYFDREGSHDMYTHVLPYTHYDILNSCGPSQSACCQFDFKRMTHFQCPGPKPQPITASNVAAKASLLESQFQEMAKMYESNVLLAVWGDDFRYGDIEEWHQQYDNLAPVFDQINKGNKTIVQFGTFTDYFTALEKYNKENSIEPPSLSGDFFPYQCALGDIWTGYYTTRPFHKRQGRQLHALIRAADTASAEALNRLNMNDKRWINDNLALARKNLSLFQHHDAITGTSKKSVMKDYSQLLFTSMNTAASVISKAISTTHKTDFNINEMPLKYSEIASKKLIILSPGDSITLAVYNSVERRRLETMTIMVSTPDASVFLGNIPILAQIEPSIDPTTGTITSYFNLVFRAVLPALSAQVFTVVSKPRNPHTTLSQVFIVSGQSKEARISANNFPRMFNVKSISSDHFSIHTKTVETHHDPRTGLLKGVSTESTGEMKLVHTVDQYVGGGGGPYIMRQTGEAKAFDLVGLSRFVVKGPLQQSVFIHSQHYQQSLVVHDVPGVQGEQLHITMRVDIRGMDNVELITRFNAGLDASTTKFYTDSNGLQLLRRQMKTGSPVQENYYPMPTAVVLQDKSRRVTILSDVEHGTTLHAPTTAEIMLDRLLPHDDGKGLGYDDDSILNDILPVQMRFTVILERSPGLKRPLHFAYHTTMAHLALQSLLYRPIVLTSKGVSPPIPSSNLASFPCDLQLVTCRPHMGSTNQRLLVLFRLGIDCGSMHNVQCPSIDYTNAVRGYLKKLGVTKVQMTTVNGLTELKPKTDVDKMQVSVKVMDFASFVVSFE